MSHRDRSIERMFTPMATELSHLLDALSIPVDAACIVEMHELFDRFGALVAEADCAFAASEMWRDQGSGSMSAWLVAEAGLGLRDARVISKRCDRLAAWPEIEAGWLDGSITGSQVDVIVNTVPSRFVTRMRDDAALMVSVLGPLDINQSAHVVHKWLSTAEPSDGPESFCDRPSGLYLSSTTGGRGVLDGDFDAAGTAAIAAALRVFELPDIATHLDGSGVGDDALDEPRTPAQRRADALIELARFGLAHHESGTDSGRHHPHVSVVVDLPDLMAATLRGAGVQSPDQLAEFAQANDLSTIELAWFADALSRPGTSQTFDDVSLGTLATEVLTCDSVIQRVITAGTRVIELGRDVRTAPPYLRRAVITRDRHCRAPGCTRPARWCDVHHIDPWITGGRTDLDRLVLLCTFHHHQFHKPGWHTELDHQARFTVHAPDGRTRTTSPPGHGPPPFVRRSATRPDRARSTG